MNTSLIEREFEVRTVDGLMDGLMVHPSRSGPYPVVLFYMDAAGRREELSEMARRIARAGYFTVLPNLYYRTTRDFRMTWSDAGIQEMLALMGTLTNDLIADDSGALLRFVEEQSQADASRIGAVGYCMSGAFVVAAAARYADRFQCTASIHGTHLVTERPDSPHRLAAAVNAEMYFACAENDKWADKSTIDTLAAALSQCSPPHRIEWYPSAQHGFVFPERAHVYDKDSAERHWDQLFALFERNLHQRPNSAKTCIP